MRVWVSFKALENNQLKCTEGTGYILASFLGESAEKMK